MDESCESGSCGSEMDQCGSYRSVEYAKALGFWAKKELLKEKVRQKIDAHYGKNLDKLADLIVEIIVERSKNMKDVGKKESELESAFKGLYDNS